MAFSDVRSDSAQGGADGVTVIRGCEGLGRLSFRFSGVLL